VPIMIEEKAMGRCTPYETVFGVGGLGDREFPAIEEEGTLRGVSLERRDLFAGMESVGKLLGQLVPADADGASLDHHLETVFHCFRFWRAEQQVYAFDEAVVRSLLDTPPRLADWPFGSPHPAFYIELPLNLFWAKVTEEQAPEPVEGLFVSTGQTQVPPGAGILLVLGMRADRPGFSTMGLAVDLEREIELEEPAAFASEIPGADLAGFYSLRRASEVVILLLRLLWYLDTYAESLERVAGSGTAKPGCAGREMPTGLDHYAVRLVERSRG